MDTLIKSLLFVHLFGMVFTLGSGVAMSVGMRSVKEPTADFDKFMDALATNSNIGLGLLWATGLLMVWLHYGFADLGPLFWVKMVFVVILSAVVGMRAGQYRKARAGDVAASQKASRMGMISGIAGLVAMCAAVFAFH